MKKIAIFNVGGASAAYIQLDDHSIVFDLGKSEDFNPVFDFLLPLGEGGSLPKFMSQEKTTKKFQITQLFLSHLDNDHIAAIDEFEENFHFPHMSVPCDNQQQNPIFRVLRNLLSKENRNIDRVLELMHPRLPGQGNSTQEDLDKPLQVRGEILEAGHDAELYHIPAGICEGHEVLNKDYANNMSLVLLLSINGYNILFTGDIMNEGMEYLIETETELRNRLASGGVDFLVVPHHGLTTSFPISLFNVIRNGKVKLNIISEKKAVKEEGDNRSDVDSRYSSPDFSGGYNIVNGLKPSQYSIMTSDNLGTHILIDFDQATPVVKRCTTEELLREFL